jgi:hypothetical protein
MKTSRLIFFAAFIMAILFTRQASAKIWRVNNKSNYNGTTLWGDNFGGTASYPVFTQIDSALAAGSRKLVASGDTLYVEASPITYNYATIDRKLIIIGSGYFLSQNPHVSSITDSSSIGTVNFNTGSEGSQIIGMSEVVGGNNFAINVNDITIKRCNVHHAIQITSNLNNVYILENFFYPIVSNLNALGGSAPYPTDLVFNNNICQKTLIWGGSFLQCNNNTFDGPANTTLTLQFTTSEFKNNILKSSNSTTNINNGSNLNVSYNIGTSASQFGTDNNNVVVTNISSLFMNSASPDGMYQVASGSIAVNSGSDGSDRGAFGGAAVTDRYTLSGLAAIPVIYSVSIPGATATDLPVTIQARTIK